VIQATAEINKEATKIAANKVKAQQNNNGSKKAILNDGEFEGPNVTLTKGTNIVANVLNVSDLHVGASVSGQGIPAGTVIVSASGNTVIISNKATVGNASAQLRAADLVKRVTFSPWEALVQAIMFSNEAAYVN